ncbi:MAG: hypothetical protein JJE15_13860 [Desulfobacteraceae bacterium]|nr:hypothetical protein [Desulfobacteraceae bacterium]
MKVIDLAAYRKFKKRVAPYLQLDNEPEFLTPHDIEELVKQGKWVGTYTPPAPYGKKDEGDEP